MEDNEAYDNENLQNSQDVFPKMYHTFEPKIFNVNKDCNIIFYDDLVHMTQHPKKIYEEIEDAQIKFKIKLKTQSKLKILINLERKMIEEIAKNENIKQWDNALWMKMNYYLNKNYLFDDIRKTLIELQNRADEYKNRSYLILVLDENNEVKKCEIGKQFLYFVSKNCEKEIFTLQQKSASNVNFISEHDLVVMLESSFLPYYFLF